MSLRYWTAVVSSALSEVSAYKGRSALAVCGVATGVATLVVAIGAIRGAFAGWERFVAENGGTNRLVVTYSAERARWGAPPGLVLSDANCVAQGLEGLARCYPEIALRGAVKAGATSKNVLVDIVGTQYDALRDKGLYLCEGRLFSDYEQSERRNVVVISDEIARRLGVETPLIGQEVAISGTLFKIVGVYGRRKQDEDLPFNGRYLTCYIPREVAGSILRWTDYISAIEVNVRSVYEVPKAREKVIQQMRFARNGADDFNVAAQLDEFRAYRRTELAMNNAVLVVTAAILAIGGMGIANVTLASINERVREIGVRVATGATLAHIRGQFLIEATMQAFIGGSAGVVFGISLLPVAGVLLPKDIPGRPVLVPEILLVALAASTICGVLAGIYPAIRAAKADPVAALRYE